MTTAIAERARRTDVHQAAPARALERLLAEFESLLRMVPPAVYGAVPESGAASVSRHVGRCLDIIETLLSARAARVIVYGPPGDGAGDDLAASRRRVEALQEVIGDWPGSAADRFVCVEQAIRPQGLDERGWSSLSTEIAFAVNHIVDTQQIIERTLRVFGLAVPKGFGSMELQPLRARSSVPPAWALWRLLDELDSLLTEVAPEVYCARFATDVSGSIGEHVRHCLDHVSALLGADGSAALSYDRRQRGTAVETDPAHAVRQILQLKRGLETWSTRALDEPIRVASMISASGDAVTGWSTLARELAFVVSHTIHHQAIIGLLLAVHGHETPDRFGHSPSTPPRH